jgi:organic radical activating enzyme
MRDKIDINDYNAHRGDSWPSWDEYLSGAYTGISEVDKELDEFTEMFCTQGKYFPIKTTTACQSKWTWNTLWLNEGTASSCHRAGWDKVSVKDFNLHNGPNKIQARKDMLEGRWPGGGCEYCRDIEQAGGHSDRHHNNLIPGLTPEEVENGDLNAVVVTQRIQEIFADNTCNLSCIYCNSNLSSKIEQENHRYGEFRQKGVWLKDTLTNKQDNKELYAKFLEWLTDNVHHLRRLHLLGGETFIQHKLMTDVLDILERKPNKDLKLCIFSNMNAPEKYWQLYIERIRNLPIKGFDLTASIDCWGPQQQYVRYGLDLELFEQRLAWASEQGDWLTLNINQSITNMTIKTMPELIKVVNKYNQQKHIGHYFEFYIGPEQYQHPKIFAYDMWEEDFKSIYSVMRSDTTEQKEVFTRLQGLEAQLKSHTTHDYKQIENLHVYLDELDRRRQTNWRVLFPYLIV